MTTEHEPICFAFGAVRLQYIPVHPSSMHVRNQTSRAMHPGSTHARGTPTGGSLMGACYANWPAWARKQHAWAIRTTWCVLTAEFKLTSRNTTASPILLRACVCRLAWRPSPMTTGALSPPVRGFCAAKRVHRMDGAEWPTTSCECANTMPAPIPYSTDCEMWSGWGAELAFGDAG